MDANEKNQIPLLPEREVVLHLTHEEAEELSTVLNSQLGKLQYRAAKTMHDTHLDESWEFWHKITDKLGNALGRTHMVSTQLSDDLLS